MASKLLGEFCPVAPTSTIQHLSLSSLQLSGGVAPTAAKNYLSEDQLGELQEYIAKTPDRGDLIPKTGGVIQSGQYQELETIQVPYPTAVRLKLGVSQSEFARLLRIPKRTIQEWEQERRKPTGAALTLLNIVESAPEVVKGILAQSNNPARTSRPA